MLFYTLWFISPKTQNLRMYQQDIFVWNQDKMYDKMKNLDFNYQIVPGKTSDVQHMQFLEKPMTQEKDEIKLREKFWYKQAYFYHGKALLNQNISDVLWVETNLQNILDQAASETEVGENSDKVYQSKTYCLNVNYRMKNQPKSRFQPLHSSNRENDNIEVPYTPPAPEINQEEQRNPYHDKADDLVETADSQEQPCLIPFVIWQERDVSVLMPEEIVTMT